MRRAATVIAAFVLCCALATGALADGDTPAVPPVLADGVTIGGVPVGGLSSADAYAAVRTAFVRPLTLLFDGYRITATPDELGAVGWAQRALAAAATAAPDTAIPLPVSVRPGPLRTYLRGVAAELYRPPVDATLTLRGDRPFLTRERPGVALDVDAGVRAVTRALAADVRVPLRLSARAVQPAVTRASFGAVIVIHRGSNHLQLYHGARLVQTFAVATGQAAYPTPLGRFSIVVKWKDPWWYPPPDPWAAGEKPTPPGPGNPLGTRWMGLSAPGVGIHGTPNAGSIGYSLSHGCIRMLIPQAEWLFDHVRLGTPVFIVAS